MRSDHLSERVDLRSYYLRLKKGIWLPFLAAAIGAVTALLIYFLSTTVFGEGRLYRAESRLYLNFSKELEESVYPYYNDYTWRDLLVTDELLDGTLDNLRAQGFTIAEESDPMDMGSRVLSEAEVRSSTFATLPSDIRLMIVQYTNHDPVIANALMEATDRSLVAFGERHREFDSIEIRAEDVAQIVTHEDKTIVALITGAVIGLLLGILCLLIRELFNDAVTTPKEAAERFHLPVIGVLTKEDGTDEAGRMLTQDLADALRTIATREDAPKNISVIAADTTDTLPGAEIAAERLRKLLPEDSEVTITLRPTPGAPEAGPMTFSDTDRVILAVRAGLNRSTMTERCIRALQNAGAGIEGILLTEADSAFYRAYYHADRKGA